VDWLLKVVLSPLGLPICAVVAQGRYVTTGHGQLVRWARLTSIHPIPCNVDWLPRLRDAGLGAHPVRWDPHSQYTPSDVLKMAWPSMRGPAEMMPARLGCGRELRAP